MSAKITSNKQDAIHASGGANPVAALFQGYDTFIGSGRSSAVAGKVQTYGTSSDLFYKTCYDTESVMKALKINASVGVVYGPVSVDAKTSYVHELSLTTYSVTVLVYSHTIVDKAVFTEVALRDTPPTDMNQFFTVYGDSFVSAIELGSEFAASYVFYAQSETERDELTASLKAHGVFTGGSVTAELSTSLESVTSSFKSQTTVEMHMAGVSNQQLPDGDHIIEFAMKFNTFPADLPSVITYTTSGYEHVPKMPQMTGLIANRRSFLGNEVDPGVSSNIATVSTILDQVSLIEGVYERYVYTGDTQLAANRTKLETAYRTLYNWVNKVEDAANVALDVPVVDIPGTPIIHFVFQTPVVFGGNGGGEFPEASEFDHAWVMNGMLPTSILLRGGRDVDRITITYDSTSDESQTYQHGGGGGSDGPTLTLQPGEYINRIYGLFDPNWVVHQLIFYTSFGQELKWPLNPSGSHTKEIDHTYQEGTVLAFRGRSGTRLDQLAPVVVVFSPARWEAVATAESKLQLQA